VKNPKLLRCGLPVLVAALATALLAGPQAQASTASGANGSVHATTIRPAIDAGDPDQGTPPCDQQNPSKHFNTTNMYDPANGAYMGYAYFVYSNGCQTEWLTVHTVSPYYPDPSIWIQNQTGTNLYEAMSSGNPQGTNWTNQLANMHTQTACGGVQMYNALKPGTGYVNWNYIGCY
jgi:hypothetical protein